MMRSAVENRGLQLVRVMMRSDGGDSGLVRHRGEHADGRRRYVLEVAEPVGVVPVCCLHVDSVTELQLVDQVHPSPVGAAVRGHGEVAHLAGHLGIRVVANAERRAVEHVVAGALRDGAVVVGAVARHVENGEGLGVSRSGTDDRVAIVDGPRLVCWRRRGIVLAVLLSLVDPVLADLRGGIGLLVRHEHVVPPQLPPDEEHHKNAGGHQQFTHHAQDAHDTLQRAGVRRARSATTPGRDGFSFGRIGHA
ncbi:hypothetical protein GY21_03325 [Cryobacterium roopkundense]|uniref:Uncharacterized protein n=1 Tax=Cryobacterium roopkundense TaxID=1001240 RepID=A0A099JP40_9MICO|nr:hypothetical protein GY21_03325 [Cryobacterium roopkundense]